MTTDALNDCLRKLSGKARSNGIYWDDTVADIYAEVLLPMPDSVGETVVASAVFERPNLPDVHELRRMAGDYGPKAAHQVRDHSQPGHELQRQGVPAYELMRQGFMSHFRKEQGFTGTWDEWVALHRDEMKPWDNVMKRLDARARGEAEGSDDPFRWRPGEPLPPESDADRARKRQAIERLREEVAR